MEYINLEKDKSLLRIFVGVEKLFGLDIYINDELVYKNINYFQFSTYEKFECQNIKLEAYSSGSKKQKLISQMVNLEVSSLYTVVIIDENPSLNLLVVNDKTSKHLDFEESAFRIVNLCNFESEVDVYLEEEKILDSINFKQGCDYISVNPNTYYMKFDLKDESKVSVPFKVNIKASKFYTLYLVENNNQINTIQSLDGNSFVIDCVTFY